MLVTLAIKQGRNAVLYFLFAVCQRSIFVLPFGKRVQRYGNFLNWQNISASFFKKNDKKEEIGQKMRKKWTKRNEKRRGKGGKTGRRGDKKAATKSRHTEQRR